MTLKRWQHHYLKLLTLASFAALQYMPTVAVQKWQQASFFPQVCKPITQEVLKIS